MPPGLKFFILFHVDHARWSRSFFTNALAFRADHRRGKKAGFFFSHPFPIFLQDFCFSPPSSFLAQAGHFFPPLFSRPRIVSPSLPPPVRAGKIPEFFRSRTVHTGIFFLFFSPAVVRLVNWADFPPFLAWRSWSCRSSHRFSSLNFFFSRTPYSNTLVVMGPLLNYRVLMGFPHFF